MKNLTITLLLFLMPGLLLADHHKKVLYKEAVAPVISAKCVGCHGADKQKGKLRLDSVAAMLKGGSEGTSLVPGKPDESTLLQRVHLPLDDDEHMPPEGKKQLTADEIKVIEFWVKSGGKETATIESLKASAEITKSITAVLAALPKGSESPKTDAPKALTENDKKQIAETIKKVDAEGGNLMSIAQDTPQLRFSALNVAKTFGDKNLQTLSPVGQHILWLDLARTQVSDGGLAQLGSMRNVTRLHLENTKISDAALDHVKGLSNLEYLNLYGTGITDTGIAKLASNKKLRKLFLWQTKTTDKGVAALAKAIPGIDINTGWKETKKVAAVTPVKKPTPAPTKPKVTPKPKPPVKPNPAPTKAVAPAKGTLELALVELTAAVQKAQKDTESAKAVYAQASKKADDANKMAEAAGKKADDASKNAEAAGKKAVDANKNAEAASKNAEVASKNAEAASKNAVAAKKNAEVASKNAEAENKKAATASKTADAASKNAATMKASFDKALDIEKRAKAALEQLKSAVEASKK